MFSVVSSTATRSASSMQRLKWKIYDYTYTFIVVIYSSSDWRELKPMVEALWQLAEALWSSAIGLWVEVSNRAVKPGCIGHEIHIDCSMFTVYVSNSPKALCHQTCQMFLCAVNWKMSNSLGSMTV